MFTVYTVKEFNTIQVRVSFNIIKYIWNGFNVFILFSRLVVYIQTNRLGYTLITASGLVIVTAGRN